MIKLKTPREIEKIRNASVIVANALRHIGSFMQPGITTGEIDKEIEQFILRSGGRPAFKGYGDRRNPYPAASCISIDEEVVHGVPGNRKLEEGMIVGVDVGVELEGYFGDSAFTFPIGNVGELKQKLMATTVEALDLAIAAIKPNASYLTDIGHAVQSRVEREGFAPVRDLVGHGIGKNLHEEPQIPNYGFPGRGPLIRPGMVFAIEPMINAGTYEVKVLKDGWTVVTMDGKPSAHYEHTVAVTEDGPVRLTIAEGK